MKILCPTCHGKGSIPDPKLNGVPMNYSGPNGEGCPHVFCQSCGGSGWVTQAEKGCCNHPAPPAAIPPSGLQIIQPDWVNGGYPVQTHQPNDGYRSQTLCASSSH